ncbi:MAG: DoxX family protein [Bdellovibrio sp.]|jgi:hypothetical protein
MILTQILQILIALGLLNVWLLRSSKGTAYRGGAASNLKDEFLVYGLPTWSYYLVGALKLGSAGVLLATLFLKWPPGVRGAAALVAVLMLGALAMHFKVKDPLSKSGPALAMLLMTSILVFLTSTY